MQSEISLYDLAKQMVATEDKMDTIMLAKEVSSMAKEMIKIKGKYFLFICPDLRQYVFFAIKEDATADSIYKELLTTIKNRGNVLLIDGKNEERFLREIWIKDKYDEQIYVYQLSDYTESVIEVK